MTTIEICNLALAKLGIPAITGFDDENAPAQLCKSLFPVLRDRVLRDHLWSFATTFSPLNALAEPSPDPDLGVVCALPGDLLRIVRLTDRRPFRRIGNRICLAALPATLIYIRQVTDSEAFDPAFSEALVYLLAAEIGMANTRDGGLVRSFNDEYRARLAAARSIDSQENLYALQTGSRRSTFLASRGGGGFGPGCPGSPTVITRGTEGREGE